MDNVTTIRILTYNFWLRPPFIADDSSGDYKDERMADFLSLHLTSYDILCFQEFFGSYSSRRARFIDAAQKEGYPYSFYSQGNCSLCSMRGIKLVDGGLLIVSKYPLENCSEMIYECCQGVDGLAEKGVLHAHVVLSNFIKLDLFVTHLQASYVSSDGWAVQQPQLVQLSSFIKEKRSPNTSALLVGDMNVDAFNVERHTRMLNLLGDSAIDLMSEHHEITYPQPPTHTAIDYMFSFSPSSIRVNCISIDKMLSIDAHTPYNQLSDHYAVAATLQLTSPKIDLRV